MADCPYRMVQSAYQIIQDAYKVINQISYMNAKFDINSASRGALIRGSYRVAGAHVGNSWLIPLLATGPQKPMFRRNTIADADAYRLLSNPRRRETVASLMATADGEITLRDLSEIVATRETGLEPAPRTHRASVYNALHQTHLPTLQTFDLVEYDRDRKVVRPQPAVRSLHRYMDTVACFGLSWGEYYRALGIASLCAVVASLAGLPVFSALNPLLITTGALTLFALSTAYQLSNTLTGVLAPLKK